MAPRRGARRPEMFFFRPAQVHSMVFGVSCVKAVLFILCVLGYPIVFWPVSFWDENTPWVVKQRVLLTGGTDPCSNYHSLSRFASKPA